MGLRILQIEIARVLGYDAPDTAENALRLQQELLLMEEARLDRAMPEQPSEERGKIISSSALEPPIVTRVQALDWLDLTQGIQANAHSAVDVLTDLLNFDKIEHGGLKLEMSVISVCSLVEQVTGEFRLPTSGKHIQYNVSFHIVAANGERRAASACTDLKHMKLVGDSIRLTQGELYACKVCRFTHKLCSSHLMSLVCPKYFEI